MSSDHPMEHRGDGGTQPIPISGLEVILFEGSPDSEGYRVREAQNSAKTDLVGLLADGFQEVVGRKKRQKRKGT